MISIYTDTSLKSQEGFLEFLVKDGSASLSPRSFPFSKEYSFSVSFIFLFYQVI